MRIKTNVHIVGIGITSFIALMFLVSFMNIEQSKFLQKNTELNVQRLEHFLSIKIAMLKAAKETSDIRRLVRFGNAQEVKIEVADFDNQVHAVKSSLVGITAINKKQKDIFATGFFTFINRDLLIQIDGSNENFENIRIQSLDILTKIDPRSSTFDDDELEEYVEKHFDIQLNNSLTIAITKERNAVNNGYLFSENFQAKIIMVSLAAVLLAILFLAYIYYALSYMLLRRLKILSGGVLKLKSGNYRIDLKMPGMDELSEVGRAFEDMAHELEKNQAALISASKMSALGEMASGIAHEVNNPLAVISARAGQMKRLLAQENLDIVNLRKFTESIEVTSTRISSIITGLRSFSRNAEKDPFQRTTLPSIMEDTLALCAERFKNHGVVIDMNLEDKLELDCRPTQIIQVMVNLLNNAHDAVGEGSERWVKISAKKLDSNVEIKVTNSGEKISPVIVDKIFQPFFTTKAIGKGTGLGLSIAQGLVQDHLGTIAIDMKSEHTCFVINLPTAHPLALAA